ncbi:MAG: response regulator [Pseudomonadota bacterium]
MNDHEFEPSSARVRGLEDRSCLVVDDDSVFRERLANALVRQGFIVSTARSVRDALTIAEFNPPAFAVVDLRLDDGVGTKVVETLLAHRPDAHALILTGYGELPSVVAAMKAGAQNVLSKPADIEDIVNSLIADPDETPEPPEAPSDPNDIRWKYIKSVFEKNDRNVSQTARVLNMHRRTLQRIMQKRFEAAEPTTLDA